MRAKDLLGYVKLGLKDCACPAFANVLLAPAALELHGDGFALRFEPAIGDRLITGGPVSVGAKWLRAALAAPTRAAPVLTLEALDLDAVDGEGKARPPKVRATIARRAGDKGKRLEVQGVAHRDAIRVKPCKLGLVPAVLAAEDFAKGGPVEFALDCAGRDETRAATYGVHLAGRATGTDGHVMMREAMLAPLAVPAMVPSPMARALIALVTQTTPDRFVLRVDTSRENGRAYFRATLPGGARWILSGDLAPVGGVGYDRAEQGDWTNAARLTVDAGDLRALAESFPAGKVHLAVYASGGMVAWGEEGDGIGSTLDSYAGGAPVLILGPAVLPRILGALPVAPPPAKVRRPRKPRKGAAPAELPAVAPPLPVEVATCQGGKLARVGRLTTAGFSFVKEDGTEREPLTDGIPSWVADEVALALGLACPVPVVRLSPADLITARFAGVAERAEARKPEGKDSPKLARERVQEAVEELARKMREAFEKGNAADVLIEGVGLDVAAAVLAMARPSQAAGGSFLRFDPGPFVRAALPAAEIPEAPASGVKLKRGTGEAARAKRAA